MGSLKNGCYKAYLAEILFEGTIWVILFNKSAPEGGKFKYGVLCNFLNLGNVG
jgi:hypothetical protein